MFSVVIFWVPLNSCDLCLKVSAFSDLDFLVSCSATGSHGFEVFVLIKRFGKKQTFFDHNLIWIKLLGLSFLFASKVCLFFY